MSTLTIVLLVILAVLIIATIALYIYGKRAEKKASENKEQMDAVAQTVPMLIIDKKMMKLKESGLPSMVIESAPRYLRGAKVPVIKAKVGAKIMNLTCESELFPKIPVKKEVKAVVSGVYITSVKGIRGPLEVPEKKKKKKFLARFRK